jgi:hypothetical protein
MQTNLQASKLLKHICMDTKLLKMPNSSKLGLDLDDHCSGLNEIASTCTDLFQNLLLR